MVGSGAAKQGQTTNKPSRSVPPRDSRSRMKSQGEFLLNEELPRIIDESLELLGRVVSSLLPASRRANGTSSSASSRSFNAGSAGRRSKYTEEFSAEENNTRLFLELDGCLIRKARIETKFT